MQQDWVVLKFGGSSVAEPSHWKTIAAVINQKIKQGLRPFLVLSALKTVSNSLEALLHQAIAGVHSQAIIQLKELHLGFASKLGLDSTQVLAPWFKSLEATCELINLAGEISPRNHALVLSIGELLSTTIGAQYLATQSLDIKWKDARQMLTSINHVDEWHHFTSAQCDYQFDPMLCSDETNHHSIIVTQGFIASDQDGETVLLGREGSDTSAAYFGAKLNAKSIEIWTDVPGVFSANPREISNARQLPELTYQQVQNLAQLGAKVLHPRAVKPAQQNQIPLFVKCTQLPLESGTEIKHSMARSSQPTISAITIIPQVTWIKIQAKSSKTIEQAKFDEKINSKMGRLGFDFVQCFNDENNQHRVFSYSNSDQQQPQDQQIFEVLNNNELEISSSLALVSLIGTLENDQWMRDVVEVSVQCFDQQIIGHFVNRSNGILSLLATKNLSLELSRKLHHVFIEKESKPGCFGASWHEFQF